MDLAEKMREEEYREYLEDVKIAIGLMSIQEEDRL